MKYQILVFAMLAFYTYAGKEYTAKYSFVEEESGKPIEGLVIELWSNEEEIIQTKTSDEDGTIVFENLTLKEGMLKIMDARGNFEESLIEMSNKKLQPINSKIEVGFSYAIIYERQSRAMDGRNKKYSSIDDPTIVAYDKITKKFTNCDEESLVEATFSGGAEGLQKYIAINIGYPQVSIERNEQGRVYLSFIVEKDGTVTNIEIERGVSIALDREARRMVYNMPQWEPATCNGEPVRFKARFPINFTLH